eukprot:gene3007-biopygen9666
MCAAAADDGLTATDGTTATATECHGASCRHGILCRPKSIIFSRERVPRAQHGLFQTVLRNDNVEFAEHPDARSNGWACENKHKGDCGVGFMDNHTLSAACTLQPRHQQRGASQQHHSLLTSGTPQRVTKPRIHGEAPSSERIPQSPSEIPVPESENLTRRSEIRVTTRSARTPLGSPWYHCLGRRGGSPDCQRTGKACIFELGARVAQLPLCVKHVIQLPGARPPGRGTRPRGAQPGTVSSRSAWPAAATSVAHCGQGAF